MIRIFSTHLSHNVLSRHVTPRYNIHDIRDMNRRAVISFKWAIWWIYEGKAIRLKASDT